jgi:hypothetical protein
MCNIAVLQGPRVCVGGVVDAAGVCCMGVVDAVTGLCCAIGATTDGKGRCCVGKVDKCGVCNGTAVAVSQYDLHPAWLSSSSASA